MTDLALLKEARNRGLLPEDKVVLLNELERREASKPEVRPNYGQASDTVISAIPAEIAGGVAGLMTMLSAPVVGRDKAVDMANENLNTVRDFLTIKPRTPEAEKGLENIGEFAAPVINALASFEKTLGDAGYDIAGPEGGAIGASLPTAIMEMIGIGLVKGGVTPLKALPEEALKIKANIDQAVSDISGKPIIAIGDDGMFSPDALEIISKNKGPEALEQAQRFNLFKEYGVEPTRFDVTQKINDAVEKQSALKRSGPVAELVAGQDRRLAEVLDQNIDDLKPTAANLQEVNSGVFGVVDNVVTDLEEGVNASYQLAREIASDKAVVKPAGLIEALRKNASKNGVTNGLIAAIRGDLAEQGVLKSGFKQAEGVGLRVERAEEIRQMLNSYYEGANPQARKLIRELKDSLDEDVADAVPVDVFQPARQAKSRMQKIIERGKRDKRDRTRGSFLESVIDNKIPEEQIVPKLLTSRLDDFKAFKRFLTQDSGAEGVQAFQNIKAQVLRNAVEKATSTAGKGEDGQVVFNSNKFKQSFANIRSTGKMPELFTPEEIKFINDIQAIGSLRIAPSMVQQGRGPTELAVKALSDQIPGATRVKGLLEAGGAVLEDRRVLDAVSEITKSP